MKQVSPLRVLILLTIAIVLVSARPYRHPYRNNARRLTESPITLTMHLQWLLNGIGQATIYLEQLLPPQFNNNQLSNNDNSTEMYNLLLVKGARDFLNGLGQITAVLERILQVEPLKLFEYLKSIVEFINESLKSSELWSERLQLLEDELYDLYQHYTPELAFGQCVKEYLLETYPERPFSEYSFIILNELYLNQRQNEDLRTKSIEMSNEVRRKRGLKRFEATNLNLAEIYFKGTEAERDSKHKIAIKTPFPRPEETLAEDVVQNIRETIAQEEHSRINKTIINKNLNLLLDFLQTFKTKAEEKERQQIAVETSIYPEKEKNSKEAPSKMLKDFLAYFSVKKQSKDRKEKLDGNQMSLFGCLEMYRTQKFQELFKMKV